jgi:DNA recombination protein RmuC
MDMLQMILVFVVGIGVGFVFAGSTLAQRLGLAGRRDDVKALALEVLQETSLQTRQMLDETGKTTKTALDDTVVRIQSEMQSLTNKVNTLENNQMSKMGELTGKIQEVLRLGEDYNKATLQLKSVWGGSKTVGDWGERNLSELVKLSGMTEYVSFATQVQYAVTDEEEKRSSLRPDMTIYCADGTKIFVDSKLVIKAYLDAIEKGAQADERTRCAKQHYEHMRKHVSDLAEKSYHTTIPNSVPFTVMYVFSDVCLSFAEEGRGSNESISQFAMQKKIIIVTPTTLFSLLNVIYENWRQWSEFAAIDELMKQVTQLGKQLDKFIVELTKHNKAMGELYGSYNRMHKVWNDDVVVSLVKVNELRAQTITQTEQIQIPTTVATFMRQQKRYLEDDARTTE